MYIRLVINKICIYIVFFFYTHNSTSGRNMASTKAFLVPNAHTGCGIQSYSGKIRGGVIAELDEFPWMALLMYQKHEESLQHGCGGVLIEANFVLTAAHCLSSSDMERKGQLKYVRLGEYNTDTVLDCIQEEEGLDCADEPLDIEIASIMIHPNYSQMSWDKHNDIAIIKLATSVDYSDFVQPICMPRSGVDFNRLGSMLYVAGWGKTDLYGENTKSVLSPIKLKLKVPLKTMDECSEAFKQQKLTIGPGQVCAGGEIDKDSCAGDSGSPLMLFDDVTHRWMVVGIVSLGLKDCGVAGVPGIYTRIDAYLDWIVMNLE